MGSYAGYRGGSWENEKADYESKAVPPAKRSEPSQIFGGYPNVHTFKLSRVGPAWFCDADNRQFAQWGFDFVKYDWRPNDGPVTKRLADSLRSCGRDIVLSLSNSAPFENAPVLSKLAQLWRTTGDVTDTWESITKIGTAQEKWIPYMAPGHWNDPDMLQVGLLGMGKSKPKHTGLTPDEQYSQVSLWCLLGAPLVLSCDLTKIDPFTFNLLCNDEVLDVDQDPRGAPAKKLKMAEEIWVRPLEDGSLAVGLFNRTTDAKTITLNRRDLPLSGDALSIRDLWRQKDLGTFGDKFETEVPRHGVVLVRIQPIPAVTPVQTVQQLSPASPADVEEPIKRLHPDGKGWGIEKANVTNPKLPRVLLIGDSILGGYSKQVVAALAGKANVDLWKNPYWQSEKYNKILAVVLDQNGPYDVVHFNMGLHGWPQGRIKEGTFEPLTKAYVEILKQKCPNAKLIWANSTPFTIVGKPTELDPVINANILEQNRMAANVMKKMNVPVNDFYALLINKLELGRGDGGHWKPNAYKVLAATAIQSILDSLKSGK